MPDHKGLHYTASKLAASENSAGMPNKPKTQYNMGSRECTEYFNRNVILAGDYIYLLQ